MMGIGLRATAIAEGRRSPMASLEHEGADCHIGHAPASDRQAAKRKRGESPASHPFARMDAQGLALPAIPVPVRA